MARAPLQVLVFPFRRRADGRLEYAVFRRADQGACWQGISGGAELGETAEQAARREMAEEAQIPRDGALLPLDATASVPAAHFAARKTWGPDVYVVTERSFGIQVPHGHAIALSDEHSECRWLPYEAATALLTWDSNKTALWELNERLRGR